MHDEADALLSYCLREFMQEPQEQTPSGPPLAWKEEPHEQKPSGPRLDAKTEMMSAIDSGVPVIVLDDLSSCTEDSATDTDMNHRELTELAEKSCMNFKKELIELEQQRQLHNNAQQLEQLQQLMHLQLLQQQTQEQLQQRLHEQLLQQQQQHEQLQQQQMHPQQYILARGSIGLEAKKQARPASQQEGASKIPPWRQPDSQQQGASKNAPWRLPQCIPLPPPPPPPKQECKEEDIQPKKMPRCPRCKDKVIPPDNEKMPKILVPQNKDKVIPPGSAKMPIGAKISVPRNKDKWIPPDNDHRLLKLRQLMDKKNAREMRRKERQRKKQEDAQMRPACSSQGPS